jgi:hypothetical protein
MKRKVANAKQKLSEVIRAAEGEPSKRPSLGEAFAELRRLCSEEGYTLEIPSWGDARG